MPSPRRLANALSGVAMEFRLLGPFEAWHDGAEIPLGDLQQRLTLAVLVLNANRPVSTERLIDIVWTGSAKLPANPDNLVIGYIARLRKIFRDFGVDPIERSATGYRLRVDQDDIDVNRLRRLHDEATEAIGRGQTDRAKELLHQAVELRRGPFLEDLDHD